MALHYSLGRVPSHSTNIQNQILCFLRHSPSHFYTIATTVYMSPNRAADDEHKQDTHAHSRSRYVVTAGAMLLHEEDSRPFSRQGCGDAQLADQQDSKQLELLSKHQRASQAQQPAAPRQKVQLHSPSQLDPNDMHHLHASPVRHQSSSSAILQSLGNQRLAFVEGCSDQASQAQLHQKSAGSCALPVEACPEDTSGVIAGKARSSLKGSKAWPPPSPSPKKSLPSPKKPSAYPKKAACSQNRQPARGLQGVSQAATMQRHTDVMALHQRLRYAEIMAAFLLNVPAAKSTAQSRTLIANVQSCRMHHILPFMLMLPFTQLV